jgi:hypothetical protein
MPGVAELAGVVQAVVVGAAVGVEAGVNISA